MGKPLVRPVRLEVCQESELIVLASFDRTAWLALHCSVTLTFVQYVLVRQLDHLQHFLPERSGYCFDLVPELLPLFLSTLVECIKNTYAGCHFQYCFQFLL